MRCFELGAHDAYFDLAKQVNPVWLKWLHARLLTGIVHRPNLRRALINVFWLIGDKVLRMGVGLLVGVWVARYLGPEQFGILNYAMAFVALFGVFAGLGLNGVVVRDLVTNPGSANETLGTTFLLQFLGGWLSFGLVVFAINFARPDDSMTKLLVAVLGFAIVLKCTDVVRYWFEFKVQSKYVVWMENGIFLVLAIVKGALILMGAPLMAFVWAAFVESALVAVGLLVVYVWRAGGLGAWRIRFGRAKELLNDSWPLILSGLAIMVYMRIDQIMLGQMLGDESVGIYSAAVRISEVWYFIPMTIVASVFPSIVTTRKLSEQLYHQRLQNLYNTMVTLALGVALPMTFFSGWVVNLLFGSAYAEAGPVLALHVWSALFVFLGVASGSGYLTEHLQMLALGRTLLGAFVNLLANYILIPSFGILGAAMGTLVAQMSAAYLFDLFHPKTRKHFWMKTKSFVSFYRVSFK
ncbi:flippase [Rhodoferax fermentans]|uniref:flippase n=1 Tax=Rhodoferax fermentans TaxID=28066 RepID=UPI0009938EC0|nr:flippase [Rhodoferax fermentans]MBK1683299.1 flippase [Rhodoferax fermentans]